VNRILLIQLRQLGDILLTSPAIRAVRKAYPDAQLDFLTHRMGKLILANNPDLDNLWTYHERESWLQQGRLLRSLKRQRYDCVVDFMYNPRSALMTWWTKAPQRIAFDSRRRWAYTHLIPSDDSSDYIVRQKFRLLQVLGIHGGQERLILPWFEKDAAIVDKFSRQEASFAESRCRVIISATHRREVRQWPVERYAQIADRLQSEWGATVIWIWGPDEEPFVESGMSFCSRPMLKAPATSFGELAALIANSDLFVGNSNGPSHVAISTDTCSLQLHGPTLAKAWCPVNERHLAIQATRMADITVDEVWRKLGSLKAEIEKKSNSRRSIGVRMNWKQTHESIPY